MLPIISIPKLFDLLKSLPSTSTKLEITNRPLSLVDCWSIVAALKRLSNIREVILTNTGLDPQKLKVLMEALKGLPNLQSIDLSHNHLDDEAALMLYAALQINDSITELVMAGNPITDVIAKALANLLVIKQTATDIPSNLDAKFTYYTEALTQFLLSFPMRYEMHEFDEWLNELVELESNQFLVYGKSIARILHAEDFSLIALPELDGLRGISKLPNGRLGIFFEKVILIGKIEQDKWLPEHSVVTTLAPDKFVPQQLKANEIPSDFFTDGIWFLDSKLIFEFRCNKTYALFCGIWNTEDNTRELYDHTWLEKNRTRVSHDFLPNDYGYAFQYGYKAGDSSDPKWLLLKKDAKNDMVETKGDAIIDNIFSKPNFSHYHSLPLTDSIIVIYYYYYQDKKKYLAGKIWDLETDKELHNLEEIEDNDNKNRIYAFFKIDDENFCTVRSVWTPSIIFILWSKAKNGTWSSRDFTINAPDFIDMFEEYKITRTYMVEAGGRAQENTQYEFYKMDELFRHLPTKFILLPNYSVLMYGSSPEKLIIADVPILKLFANLKHFSTVPEKIAALQKSMKSLASTSITTVAKRIDSSVRPTVPKIIESAKPNTFIKPASILKSSTVFASTSNLAKVMINETDYTVNTDYLYEDNDVNAILNERIVELGGSIHGTPVEVMAAANTMSPNQLKDILNAHEPGKRLVMIPCNIGNFHWVGLLFEFDEDSQLIRAEYIDSANIPVPATLNIQLQSLYPGNTFVPRNDLIRQHGDGTSCGPCTIENLILAAQNASPEESVSMSSIRAQHLALWQVKRPGDYVAFERRQRENRPTFNASVSLGFKSKPKSESEVTGIKQVAELINNVKDEAIKEALISAIRGEGLDEAKHGEHLIAIRRVCFDHRKNPEIQAIAEHLFGIADLSAYEKFDDYFKDSNLSFEYECLQDISQLLAKPSMVTPTLS